MEGVAAGNRGAEAYQPFRDRVVRLFAVGEVGVLAALVVIVALLLRPRAGVPVGPQHPRDPHRRFLHRHHRHRPDDPARLRRVRPVGRLGRGPERRGQRQADDCRRPAGSDRDRRRHAGRGERRPRQRPRRRQAEDPGLHPDPRHAVHRPGPDPARHQRLPGLSAARGRRRHRLRRPDPRARLELRLLHRRRDGRRLRAPPDRARPEHVRDRRQPGSRAPRRHQHQRSTRSAPSS